MGNYSSNETARSAIRVVTDVLKSESMAGDVMQALHDAGYVCVPHQPTQRMLDAAYYACHAEKLGEVWEEMIGAVD